MEDDSKVDHDNEWKTYPEKNSQLDKQRRHKFFMIIVQCMKVILDKMKHDKYWDNRSESYYPLTLIKIIEKNIGSDQISIFICNNVRSKLCTVSLQSTKLD